MGKAKDLITVREARAALGISPAKMSKLIREGVLKYWLDPLDARVKLVSRAEVNNLKPRPAEAAT